ncbi:hypothetical protein D910_06365, partial [Dendroctonus ponderosae]
FPKSSTDGALSSVLHVQESNLSSDDFHEALFLLERSPKTRDSKRRKKSKKKEKERDTEPEDISSSSSVPIRVHQQLARKPPAHFHLNYQRLSLYTYVWNLDRN